MEKGKDLLHISITKWVVPRCIYTESQKFHLLRIELSGRTFSAGLSLSAGCRRNSPAGKEVIAG